MPYLVEDLTLIESSGIDNVNARVLKAFLGPGCYSGGAETLGWHLSLYVYLYSEDFDKPRWTDWKIAPIGQVDKEGNGSWHFFPCNAKDVNGNPDIFPPSDLKIVPNTERKGYLYYSPTLCQALLGAPNSEGKQRVDMDKLQASPYIGMMPFSHAPAKAGGLRAGTKYAVLQKSILDTTFPPAKMSANFLWLVGCNFHWVQCPPPKQWKDYDGTVLGVDTFLDHSPTKAQQILQGLEAGVAPTVAPAVATPTIVADPAAGVVTATVPQQGFVAAVEAGVAPVVPPVGPVATPVDIPSDIQSYIVEQLTANPAGIPKGSVAAWCMRTFTGPNKGEALRLLRAPVNSIETWAAEMGMWQMSPDGVNILPV